MRVAAVARQDVDVKLGDEDLATGAEEILTKDYYDWDQQRIISEIISKKKLGKRLHLIINAHSVGKSSSLAKNIDFATGLETRATILGLIQNGGRPTCQDRVYASAMGGKAVDLVNSGMRDRVVVYSNGEFKDVDFAEALAMEKKPDPFMYEMSKKLARS